MHADMKEAVYSHSYHAQILGSLRGRFKFGNDLDLVLKLFKLVRPTLLIAKMLLSVLIHGSHNTPVN